MGTMNKATFAASLLVLFAFPLPALAQTAEPSAKAACAAILARHVEPRLDPRVEADCDSSAFYYGIGRERDYAAAAACAEMERFKQVNKDDSLFTGSGVLAMVYANGEGVPRNVEDARHYVCEIKEADAAETEARLKLLDQIAMTPKGAPHFDLCKTGSSGLSEGWCASIEVRLHDAKRYEEMVKIFDALTPAGQEAFKKLQAAEGAFEEQRTVKEVDQTGTARGAFSLEEEDRMRAQFVSDLKLFAKPDFSEPVTLAVVDAKVNAEYANLQANGARIFRDGTITPAGVAETQAAYIKLREAWRAYAAVVYPTVAGDAVVTQLARERLYHLHKLSQFQ
jgi:TPR repeat protein